jgi:hypothetical protein
VLNLIWAHLLPGMAPGALPQDKPAHEALTRRLGSLSLLPVQGLLSSSVATKTSGKGYAFAGKRRPLQAISFDFGGDEDRCTVRDDRGEHRVACGRGAWVKGTTAWDLTRPPAEPRGAPQPRPVAASGAWITDDTYEMKLVFYATPFCFTMTCRFGHDKLKLKPRMNVSFGPTEFPQLTGQLTT